MNVPSNMYNPWVFIMLQPASLIENIITLSSAHCVESFNRLLPWSCSGKFSVNRLSVEILVQNLPYTAISNADPVVHFNWAVVKTLFIIIHIEYALLSSTRRLKSYLCWHCHGLASSDFFTNICRFFLIIFADFLSAQEEQQYNCRPIWL